MLEHRFTAGGGETTIEVPWVYTPDLGLHAVLVDGDPVAFREATPRALATVLVDGVPQTYAVGRLALGAPLAAGAAVVVRAALPSLFDALPRAWRTDEPGGLTADVVGALDGEASDLLAELRGLFALRDVRRCPAWLLPELAWLLGWDLDPSLPVALQRKVVRLLVPLYKQKGTLPGIVNVLRLFLGLEVAAGALWAGGWRLGRSRLGRDTRLAPAVDWLFVARGGETVVPLPFAYRPGRGELDVTVDGVGLDAGPGYTEPSPTAIALRTPLRSGQLVHVGQLALALTIVVRTPRALTADERALTLQLLDVWKPSRALVRLVEPGAPAPGRQRWRLGVSRLGRVDLAEYDHVVTAAGGERRLLLPYVYAVGADRLVVTVNGAPAAFAEVSPSEIVLGAPLAPGDRVVVRYRGTTRLG